MLLDATLLPPLISTHPQTNRARTLPPPLAWFCQRSLHHVCPHRGFSLIY